MNHAMIYEEEMMEALKELDIHTLKNLGEYAKAIIAVTCPIGPNMGAMYAYVDFWEHLSSLIESEEERR